jgi:hypothetical protein
MNGDLRHARELRELVERYSELTETALHACAALDDGTFTAALDARELITSRVCQLTREMAADRPVARGLPPRADDQVLAPVQTALVRAQHLDDELVQGARRWRASLGDQLDRLHHDERAATAYATGLAPLPSGGLDVTR